MTRTLLSATALCTAALLASSPALAGELVTNGGFETGNFAGWSVPPNVPMQSNHRIQTGGGGHVSTFYAQLSSSQLEFISQILPTQAGTDYELSFWLRRTSGAPSLFVARWEGEEIMNQVFSLPEPFSWNHFSFPITADINGSLLEFGQHAFPGEFHIDDISVVQVPAPGAAALLGMTGLLTLGRRPRRGAQ